MQQQLDAIDKQIKGWEDYKKAWSDTVDEYKNKANEMYANQVLHAGWESNILDKKNRQA